MQQYSGDWTWTPNSTWVNDFRVGYVFNRNQTVIGDGNMIPGNPWPSGYGMPTGVTNPLYGGLPTITFSSLSGVVGRPMPGRAPAVRQATSTWWTSVSYLRGKHAFKYGFEYVDQIHDANNFTNAQGTLLFSNLQNFLQGSPTNGSIGIGNPKIVVTSSLVCRIRAGRLAHQAQDDLESWPALRVLHVPGRALQRYRQL